MDEQKKRNIKQENEWNLGSKHQPGDNRFLAKRTEKCKYLGLNLNTSKISKKASVSAA